MASNQSVNGTLILVFGILGLVCCGIFGPIAWVMGNNALATLSGGGGDPNQRGLVVAGRICGIIGTVFLLLQVAWIVFGGGLAVFTAAMNRGGGG
jgi:hypothetical protein